MVGVETSRPLASDLHFLEEERNSDVFKLQSKKKKIKA